MEQGHFVFLEIAFHDLKVSKELYISEHFPHSIFYLQQSIEKAVKFIGLKNESIKVSELMHSIGHITSKIFKKEIVKYLEYTEYNTPEELYKEFQSIAQTIHETSDELMIPELIDIIENFNDSTNEGSAISAMDSPDKLIEFLKKYDLSAEIDIEQLESNLQNPIFKELILDMIKNFKPNLIEYIKSIQILFMLTNYFEKLVSTVRYPNDQFISPSEIFTKEDTLVKTVPYFQEKTYICFKRIQKHFID